MKKLLYLISLIISLNCFAADQNNFHISDKMSGRIKMNPISDKEYKEFFSETKVDSGPFGNAELYKKTYTITAQNSPVLWGSAQKRLSTGDRTLVDLISNFNKKSMSLDLDKSNKNEPCLMKLSKKNIYKERDDIVKFIESKTKLGNYNKNKKMQSELDELMHQFMMLCVHFAYMHK